MDEIGFLLLLVALFNYYIPAEGSSLETFSFGNSHTDLVKKQMESAKFKNINLKVIEQDGHIFEIPKLKAMRDYAREFENQDDTIVLFTESGSLFLNSSEEIVTRFKSMDANVVLSSDYSCHPDISLKDLYPEVGENEKRFVSVNGVIGYAKILLKVLQDESLQTIEDDQYFFSKIFVNSDLRAKYKVKLDSNSVIFQNMDGPFEEVSIEHSLAGEGFLLNVLTNTTPTIVQPSGNKNVINALTNYLGNSWHPLRGCQHCPSNRIESEKHMTVEIFPKLTISIFIDFPTPFLLEFFSRISSLTYPKSQMHMRISNMVPSQESVINDFINKSGKLFRSVVYIDSAINKSAQQRRTDALGSCLGPDCEYILFIDSAVHLTNENTIQSLLSYNKSLLAPLVSRREQLWSNFWGAISYDGYYSRSFDYLDIVNGVQKGIWNIPHIHSIYLMKQELLPMLHNIYEPIGPYKPSEIDMIFSGNLRKKDLFMFVANEDYYGHLIDAEKTTTEHLHNDLWEILSNPLDWREKYIHEDYNLVAHESFSIENVTQPCRDVFVWPLVSETFAKEMIEEIEHLVNGSDNEMAKLTNMHMKDIGWEEHWAQVLKSFVYPMQTKLYKGFYDEPQTKMNFIVRQQPKNQDKLPLTNVSTSYSLSIALKKPGIDYEGGGLRFVRYECSVHDSKIGHVLMYPGRVTHFHQILPVLKGLSYTFMAFII